MGLDLRSGSRAVSAAFALTAALAACSSGVLRDPFHPNFLGGGDAAKRVDVYLGGMLAATRPSLVVGRARCPALLDLSGGRRGLCTLPVAGRELRVDVSSSASPTGVQLLDTLVERHCRTVCSMIRITSVMRYGKRRKIRSNPSLRFSRVDGL